MKEIKSNNYFNLVQRYFGNINCCQYYSNSTRSMSYQHFNPITKRMFSEFKRLNIVIETDPIGMLRSISNYLKMVYYRLDWNELKLFNRLLSWYKFFVMYAFYKYKNIDTIYFQALNYSFLYKKCKFPLVYRTSKLITFQHSIFE